MTPLEPGEITIGMNIVYIGKVGLFKFMTPMKTYKVLWVDHDGWPEIRNDRGGTFVLGPQRFSLGKYTQLGERL